MQLQQPVQTQKPPKPPVAGWQLEVTQLVSLAFLLIGLACVMRRVMDIGLYKAFGFENVDVRIMASAPIDLAFLGGCLAIGLFLSHIVRYYLAAWLVELAKPPWTRREAAARWAEELLRYLAVVGVYSASWVMQQSSESLALNVVRWLPVFVVGVFLVWDLLAIASISPPTAADTDQRPQAKVAWRGRARRWFFEDLCIVVLLLAWNWLVIPSVRNDPQPGRLWPAGVAAILAAACVAALVVEVVVEQRSHGIPFAMVTANRLLRRLIPFAASAVASGTWLYLHCHPCPTDCQGPPPDGQASVRGQAALPPSGLAPGAQPGGERLTRILPTTHEPR